VHLYDAKTHQKIMEWDDTYTFGGFRDLSADETIVATVLVSDDNIILWDVETGEQLVTLDHPSVSNITFSPDGRYMVSNAVDGTLRLWGVLKAM
jgi:WD40 repeat protein